MDGIINIYKEPGFTSHDVVAKLRGILHQKKIGHTGTLDPDAAGVLPVCCGKATKICSLLTDKDKTYHAVCQLGIETDTQDISGKMHNFACRLNLNVKYEISCTDCNIFCRCAELFSLLCPDKKFCACKKRRLCRSQNSARYHVNRHCGARYMLSSAKVNTR